MPCFGVLMSMEDVASWRWSRDRVTQPTLVSLCAGPVPHVGLLLQAKAWAKDWGQG